MARLIACFGIAIHGFWIPAIPAGMTAVVFNIHLCITMSAGAWERTHIIE